MCHLLFCWSERRKSFQKVSFYDKKKKVLMGVCKTNLMFFGKIIKLWQCQCKLLITLFERWGNTTLGKITPLTTKDEIYRPLNLTILWSCILRWVPRSVAALYVTLFPLINYFQKKNHLRRYSLIHFMII